MTTVQNLINMRKCHHHNPNV